MKDFQQRGYMSKGSMKIMKEKSFESRMSRRKNNNNKEEEQEESSRIIDAYRSV